MQVVSRWSTGMQASVAGSNLSPRHQHGVSKRPVRATAQALGPAHNGQSVRRLGSVGMAAILIPLTVLPKTIGADSARAVGLPQPGRYR